MALLRLPHPKTQFTAVSLKGKVRRVNEDAWGCFTPRNPVDLVRKGTLYVVADGVGGHHCGDVASRLAVESIHSSYYKGPTTEQPPDGLERAFKWACRTIYYEAQKRKQCQGMASTAVACVLVAQHAYVASVGDSRAYIFRRSHLVPITEDHTIQVESPDKKGSVQTMLSRALGSSLEVDVDLFRVEVEPQDRLLLCTDGLTSEVPADVIQETLQMNANIKRAVHALTFLANSRGGRDNITVLLIRLLSVPGKGFLPG